MIFLKIGGGRNRNIGSLSEDYDNVQLASGLLAGLVHVPPVSQATL